MSNEIVQIDQNVPATFNDAIRIGQVFKDSGYFKDTASEAQAITKVLAGKELGIPPFAAMSGIHIIQGKAELGYAMLAGLIKRSPNYNYRVTTHTIQECIIQFMENGEPCGVSSFSMDDANKAGLLSNPTWKKYPKNMLFARAISNGFKFYCPDLSHGMPVYHDGELGGLNGAAAPQAPPKAPKAERIARQIEARVVDAPAEDPADKLLNAPPEDAPASVPADEKPQKRRINKGQRERLFEALKESGKSPEAFKSYLDGEHGLEGTEDIRCGEMYDEICLWVVAEPKADASYIKPEPTDSELFGSEPSDEEKREAGLL